MRAVPIQRLKEAERLVAAGHHAAARELLEPILGQFPANPRARKSMALAWYREGIDLARFSSMKDFDREVRKLEKRMKKAAEALEFEEAASLRDRIAWLRRHAVFS